MPTPKPPITRSRQEAREDSLKEISYISNQGDRELRSTLTSLQSAMTNGVTDAVGFVRRYLTGDSASRKVKAYTKQIVKTVGDGVLAGKANQDIKPADLLNSIAAEISKTDVLALGNKFGVRFKTDKTDAQIQTELDRIKDQLTNRSLPPEQIAANVARAAQKLGVKYTVGEPEDLMALELAKNLAVEAARNMAITKKDEPPSKLTNENRDNISSTLQKAAASNTALYVQMVDVKLGELESKIGTVKDDLNEFVTGGSIVTLPISVREYLAGKDGILTKFAAKLNTGDVDGAFDDLEMEKDRQYSMHNVGPGLAVPAMPSLKEMKTLETQVQNQNGVGMLQSLLKLSATSTGLESVTNQLFNQLAMSEVYFALTSQRERLDTSAVSNINRIKRLSAMANSLKDGYAGATQMFAYSKMSYDRAEAKKKADAKIANIAVPDYHKMFFDPQHGLYAQKARVEAELKAAESINDTRAIARLTSQLKSIDAVMVKIGTAAYPLPMSRGTNNRNIAEPMTFVPLEVLRSPLKSPAPGARPAVVSNAAATTTIPAPIPTKWERFKAAVAAAWDRGKALVGGRSAPIATRPSTTRRVPVLPASPTVSTVSGDIVDVSWIHFIRDKYMIRNPWARKVYASLARTTPGLAAQFDNETMSIENAIILQRALLSQWVTNNIAVNGLPTLTQINSADTLDALKIVTRKTVSAYAVGRTSRTQLRAAGLGDGDISRINTWATLDVDQLVQKLKDDSDEFWTGIYAKLYPTLGAVALPPMFGAFTGVSPGAETATGTAAAEPAGGASPEPVPETASP